jgi:hypothetical protein
MKDRDQAAQAVQGTGEAPAGIVQVKFEVTQHAALIGDAHHAAGKVMTLPKPQAEEAERQRLGKIVGVA